MPSRFLGLVQREDLPVVGGPPPGLTAKRVITAGLDRVSYNSTSIGALCDCDDGVGGVRLRERVIAVDVPEVGRIVAMQTTCLNCQGYWWSQPRWDMFAGYPPGWRMRPVVGELGEVSAAGFYTARPDAHRVASPEPEPEPEVRTSAKDAVRKLSRLDPDPEGGDAA